MKITEKRTMTTTDLYRLCNAKNWYTCGTNAEYELLFGKAKGNMTTEKLIALAEDIIAHSAPKCFTECEPNGTTPIQYVLFELADICTTTFDIGERA